MACGNTTSPDDARAAAGSASSAPPPAGARDIRASSSVFVRDGRVDYAAAAKAATKGAKVAESRLAESLLSAWAKRYDDASVGQTDVVQVDLDGASYLFDIANERVVGVVGTSTPTPAASRDKSRIAGSPSPNRPGDEKGRHRGHLLAHTIGGGLDMNVIDQAANVNLGKEWREYERYAEAHPGTFVAVHVVYTDDGQRPAGLEYGIVRDGQFEHRAFDNS